jgi:FdhD protein
MKHRRRPEAALRPIRYQSSRHGSSLPREQRETVDAQVIVEAPVTLTVNGQVWLSFMCTPTDLEALAAGFLFNEGVIQKREDIASIYICPTGNNVDVWLAFNIEQPHTWRRTSGCTGGVTAAKENPNPFPNQTRPPTFTNGGVLTPEQIDQLLEQLHKGQDLYCRAGGVHTSILSDGKSPRLIAEDIGRHNTLDKIAGHYLLEGLELPRKILLTTGRISSEMLQKAARIGAAVVISRTSPSSLSIEMAQEWGITLIGYARRGQFNIYTHPERIIQPESAPADEDNSNLRRSNPIIDKEKAPCSMRTNAETSHTLSQSTKKE